MSKKQFKEEFLKSLKSEINSPKMKIVLEPVVVDTAAHVLNIDELSDIHQSKAGYSNPAAVTIIDATLQTSSHFPTSIPAAPEIAKNENLSQKLVWWRRPFFWSVSLLSLGAIFCSLAGLNVYAESRRDQQQKNISDCKDLIQETSKKGLSVDGLSCEASFGWQNLFGQDESSQVLEQIRQQVTSSENDQKSLIQEQDDSIFSTQTKLKNLQVELDKEGTGAPSKADFDNPDLQKQLQQKKLYAVYLQSLLTQNLKAIQDSIETYDKYIQTNGDLDWSSETVFLTNYKALSQDAQIVGFSDFRDKLSKVEDKVNLALPIGKRTITLSELSKYKNFSAAEFQALYESMIYDKVTPTTASPSITGNTAADQHIIAIAESRGYKKRAEAIQTGLVSVDGQTLQTQTRDAWTLMKQAASREGINLGLVSGFRSIDLQRSLFSDSLQEAGVQKIGRAYTTAEIISGKADDGINSVLDTRSIPGYSKHHTGYTLDVTDSGSSEHFTAFRNTPAYTWMSANNYYNVKRFGFIPSYPTGGTNYGPEPEAWEYVWVGEKNVLK